MGKLIYCHECHDLFALHSHWRRCTCKAIGGKYNKDGDTVTITKSAVLFGFCNHLKHPERFSDMHVEGCSNAWPYPENWKVTRVD